MPEADKNLNRSAIFFDVADLLLKRKERERLIDAQIYAEQIERNARLQIYEVEGFGLSSSHCEQRLFTHSG